MSLKKLGDENYPVRQAASQELLKRMPAATRLLQKHLNDGDPEVRERVQSLFVAYWRECALSLYLKAFASLAPSKDFHAHLAGQGYLRLIKDRGIQDSEKEQVAKIEAEIRALPPLDF